MSTALRSKRSRRVYMQVRAFKLGYSPANASLVSAGSSTELFYHDTCGKLFERLQAWHIDFPEVDIAVAGELLEGWEVCYAESDAVYESWI